MADDEFTDEFTDGFTDAFTDDLPALLTGELGRDRLREVVAHLRTCSGCRAGLVDDVASHAALTATRRTLSAAGPLGSAARAQVDLEDDVALPPLAPHHPRRTTRGRVLGGLVAAAVVAALALGGLAVSGNWPGGSQRQPAATATAQAELEPVASPTGPAAPGAKGLVQMRGPAGRTDMTISTTGLPRAASGHFYYAWLLDPKTNKMLPLGVIVADSASTFEVSSDLVARYGAIDISLQADDGNPEHSPVSVLRATYAA